ncbi:MAG: UDP-N-acetylmuramate dehydrogenase [Lachnospiraceae bacterium]|nr:UDP-N-acetylmuramate dehydrogenase [Lachnospiraceae bacterium]
MDRSVFDKLSKCIAPGRIIENARLSEYTSFKTGGPADILVKVGNSIEIQRIVAIAKESDVPFYVIGNGTNMLVSDEGYRGIVICLREMDNDIRAEKASNGDYCRLSCSAGCTLARLSSEAASMGYSGLEFAAGIPGSVGGAVVMNAGAYGGEIKDVFEYADVLDENGDVIRLKREDMDFGYRKSIIQEKEYIVLDVMFVLKKGEENAIKAEIKELNERRREKQPLEYASAGSTFKRPEGLFAGKLIEDAGLKGFSVGDAAVSEKHCGFLINKGKATSTDIYELISQVIEKVYEKSGVVLEPEIKLLGFEE